MNARDHFRKTLVVVEDNDSAVAAFELALQDLPGLQLVRYRRAEQALALIEADTTGSCCALVTDLHLVAMDGFELVRRVRERRAEDAFPIVVVSGDSDPGTPERVMRLGASAFFPKPFSPLKLRRTLESLLDENNTPNLSA